MVINQATPTYPAHEKIDHNKTSDFGLKFQPDSALLTKQKSEEKNFQYKKFKKERDKNRQNEKG